MSVGRWISASSTGLRSDFICQEASQYAGRPHEPSAGIGSNRRAVTMQARGSGLAPTGGIPIPGSESPAAVPSVSIRRSGTILSRKSARGRCKCRCSGGKKLSRMSTPCKGDEGIPGNRPRAGKPEKLKDREEDSSPGSLPGRALPLRPPAVIRIRGERPSRCALGILLGDAGQLKDSGLRGVPPAPSRAEALDPDGYSARRIETMPRTLPGR